MEEALSFLHSAGLSEAAKFAAGTVLCCVDEAQKIPPALEREAEMVLLRVTEAWQKLVSLPPGATFFGHPPRVQPVLGSSDLIPSNTSTPLWRKALWTAWGTR